MTTANILFRCGPRSPEQTVSVAPTDLTGRNTVIQNSEELIGAFFPYILTPPAVVRHTEGDLDGVVLEVPGFRNELVPAGLIQDFVHPKDEKLRVRVIHPDIKGKARVEKSLRKTITLRPKNG